MKFFFIYIAAFLSYAFLSFPHISYWLSWSLSFIVLLGTFRGWLVPYPQGVPWARQIMRPLYLPHAIYAVYMALTSPFAYFDALGYRFFDHVSFVRDDAYFETLALAQLCYALFHIGLVHALAMTSRYDYTETGYRKKISFILYRILIVSFILGIVTSFIPGLGQFQEKFTTLGLVGASITLVYGLREKNYGVFLVVLVVWLYSMYKAFTSGWKEQVLVPFILVGAFFYPFYKRYVLSIGIPIFVGLLYILPIYVNTIREESWNGGTSGDQAALTAYAKLSASSDDYLLQENWDFLAYRLSEIKLFVPYIEHTPYFRSYYGFEILLQGLESLLPRAIYTDKPNLEVLVRARVAENKAVENAESVSAKPQMVVDGYLSFGLLGALSFGLLLGALSGGISVWLEKLFGSYMIGSALMFNGLFSIFWRGNCIEFTFGIIFWSLVTAYLMRLFFRGLFIS